MDISETIHLLGDLLGEVLIEQESPAFFEIEERVRAQAKARRSEDPGSRRRRTSAGSGRQQWTFPPPGGLPALLHCTLTWSIPAEDNYRMNVLRQEAFEKP